MASGLCRAKEKALTLYCLLNIINQIRKRTEPKDIVYSLHLHFSSLSLRNTSKAISRFVQKSHNSAIRDWIQKYKPERLSYSKTKTSEFVSMKHSSK
jgi:hypothetical protein